MATVTPSPAQVAGEKRPAPLACLECRRKHLKCDAKQPCTRCKADKNMCSYISSRRGYRGPLGRSQRTNGSDREDLKGTILDLSNMERVSAPEPTSSVQNGIITTEPMTPLNDGLQSYMTGQLHPEPASMNFDFLGPDLTPFSWQSTDRSCLVPARSRDETGNDYQSTSRQSLHLTDLYYEYFHDPHPILLPRTYTRRNMHMPDYLQRVVELIGSQYSNEFSSEQSRLEVVAALQNNRDRTVAKVQALLLLSIALHARNEQTEALDTIDSAVELARELGINRKAFLAQHFDQDPVALESVRRTWWELYITNGWLSALHQWNNFKANTIPCDMDLPCEDADFASCTINSQPRTLSQLQNRAFSEVDPELSSFSYRIEAIKILARVMAVEKKSEAYANEIDAIDSLLASWPHLLPPSKKSATSHAGRVDELLFQAQTIVHCASIYLHLPRSDLLPSPPTNADVDCVRRMPSTAPSSSKHEHAVKAAQAANALSALSSLRAPPQRHTPFFICSLVLGAVVQLSACSVRACSCLAPHRDRIISAVGLLRALADTWAIAWQVMRQIKKVASDVLKTGLQPDRGADEAVTVAVNGGPTNIESILDDSLWMNAAGSAEFLGPPSALQ